MSEQTEEIQPTEDEREQKHLAAVEKIIFNSSIEVTTNKGQTIDVDLIDIFKILVSIVGEVLEEGITIRLSQPNHSE